MGRDRRGRRERRLRDRPRPRQGQPADIGGRSRPSFKQSLTPALGLRIAELARELRANPGSATADALSRKHRDDLRRARELRTGPTPAWAIELALELGLPAPKRSSTTSST